jgi:hypothetical protein
VALKNVIGIDHAVVMVRDLDQAAANWKRLGFTLSPRGTHSAKMGSGNYTIMLDPDYIELLGVLTETEHNAPARAFLTKRGEGIERMAFTAIDSAAGAEEIRGHGYAALGPTDFERPVTMPDGSLSAAKFRIFQWPIEEAPAEVRIFACQHKTRETVWIPELMRHPNGARRRSGTGRPQYRPVRIGLISYSSPQSSWAGDTRESRCRDRPNAAAQGL